MAKRKVQTGEVGVAGNTGHFGYANTGEYLTKVDGSAGRVVFDKMRRSDHQVRAVLSAITLPIRQAEYFVEPASEAEADVQLATRIQDALLKEMSIPWDDTVRHALLMLPFGFSPLEKVWELREGLVLPRKLDPRLPSSVIRWEYDNSRKRLQYMVQRDSDGREIRIPIEKLLVFSTDKEGDNWEGCSILRPAYKAWYIKDTLEKVNSIMHERFGAGIPRGKVPRNVAKGTTEWNAVRDTLEDIHVGEKAYVIQPEGYEFDVIGGEKGKGTDVLGSIKYYDEAIAKAMLAMHINLGTAKSGSYALGQSFLDAFLMATQAWADYIAEVINRFVVREIVDYNWSVDAYPTFRCKRIQSLAFEAIGYLVQTGALKWTQALENDLRGMLRMPKLEERGQGKEGGERPDEEPEEGQEDAVPQDR